MSLTGVLLGLINICIVVAILVLVGYVILWILGLIGFAVPDMVQKLFMIIVALIAIYMVVALLLGIPTHFKIVEVDRGKVVDRGEAVAAGVLWGLALRR